MPRSWHSFTSYFSCMADGIAALIAEGRRILVERAALVADHVAGLIGIGDNGRAAIAASGAQMVQALQVAALAFPVADRVVHEFELRQFAEILDRKHGGEDGLQTAVIALARQQVHLQEALIGLPLDFDQVRNLNRALNFREIETLAFPDVLVTIWHCLIYLFPFGQLAEKMENGVQLVWRASCPKSASTRLHWVQKGPMELWV